MAEIGGKYFKLPIPARNLWQKCLRLIRAWESEPTILVLNPGDLATRVVLKKKGGVQLAKPQSGEVYTQINCKMFLWALLSRRSYSQCRHRSLGSCLQIPHHSTISPFPSI